MKSYEKKALLKFFGIYFGSVLILMLVSSSFYLIERKDAFVKNEILGMFNYSRLVKHSKDEVKIQGYKHEISNLLPSVGDPTYYEEDENNFYKDFPKKGQRGTIRVIRSKDEYYKNYYEIINNVALLVSFSTILLACVSYMLAKLAILPMREAIETMDRFIKDTIHDINTPTSAILLNLKLLEKNANDVQIKKLERIKKSADTISSLYENMSVLLSEEKLKKEEVNVHEIIYEKIEYFKLLYPNLTFTCKVQKLTVQTNKKALERIVDNLLVNACKYNKENGNVDFTCKNNILIIQDTGIGMNYPERIFERNYSEEKSGFGIGMHIVHRLCERLNIRINIESKKGVGTKFTLKFDK